MKRLLIWGASDQAVVTLDCAQAMQMYGQIDVIGIATQPIRLFAQHPTAPKSHVHITAKSLDMRSISAPNTFSAYGSLSTMQMNVAVARFSHYIPPFSVPDAELLRPDMSWSL